MESHSRYEITAEYSPENKTLAGTVKVTFENTKNHAEDFERQFSATREFDSSQQLNDVQEELVTQMIDEIVEQIFNATVANW